MMAFWNFFVHLTTRNYRFQMGPRTVAKPRRAGSDGGKIKISYLLVGPHYVHHLFCFWEIVVTRAPELCAILFLGSLFGPEGRETPKSEDGRRLLRCQTTFSIGKVLSEFMQDSMTLK